MRYDLRNRQLFQPKICKFIPGCSGPNDHRDANECSDDPLTHSERNNPDNSSEADRLIDRAPAMRLHSLADPEVSSPPTGRVSGYLIGSRPPGGRNALRKSRGQLGLPAFGLTLRHGTKWYSVVRNSKNSRLSLSRFRAPSLRSAPRPRTAKKQRIQRRSRGSQSARRGQAFSNRRCVD